MKGIKRKVITWLVTLALIIGAMPVGVFAADYDNHWAKNAIAKWSDKGIVQGYADGSFKPSKQVTRAELAVFIVRLFGLTDTKNAKHFEDVSTGKWYANDVAKISSAGLMYVEGNKFMPDQAATREEAAYALAKAYKIAGKSDKAFKDQEDISSWASETVGALFASGYISGKGQDKFAPKDTLTRADVVTMIDKMTSELISKAGTYNQDVKGNLVVNTRDVILKDMTIKGNLYLAPGIGDGDVTLEGITVEGKTFIEGGGINSIRSRDSKFYDSLQVSASNPVRLVVEGDSVKVEALPGTTVTLTGNFKEVILTENVSVTIKDAQVQNIIVQPALGESKNAKAPAIEITAGSTVKQIQADAPVTTTGTGKIEALIVNSEGVKVEQKPTKTEVKNADIKVEVAGKVQTQATVNTPAAGGGAGSTNTSNNSSNSSSVTPVTPAVRCEVKGKVTFEGEAVKYAHVNIFQKVGSDNKEIAHTETSVNGEYSFYANSGQNYWVEAWLVDTNGYGYHTSKENIVVSANPTTINIELTKRYVADITLKDKNGALVREAKIVEVEDGKEINWWHTDNYGFIGLFLWQDKEYTYDVYVEGILVAQITNVKREADYKTERTVTLNIGLTDTINGTAVFEDGRPAPNFNVNLLIMNEKKDQTTTKHSDWINVASVKTDQDGKFIFRGINPLKNYQVHVRDESSTAIYLSDWMDPLVANKLPLKVKQGYVIDLTVVDKDGQPINDADVKVLETDGGYHTTSTRDDGKVKICYPEMEPGNHILKVTVGTEVIAQPLTIVKGTYSYTKNVKFENTSVQVLSVSVEGTLQVLNNQLVAKQVIIFGDGGGKIVQLENGKAQITIPQSLKNKKVTLIVTDAKDTVLYKQESIVLVDSKIELPIINLSAVPTCTLQNMDLSLVTTDSTLHLDPQSTTGPTIWIYKEAINGFYNNLSTVSQGPIILPQGNYKFLARYSDTNTNRYKGFVTWNLNTASQETVNIKLRPSFIREIEAVDEDNNILKDVYFDITTIDGVERQYTGTFKSPIYEFYDGQPVAISLCNGSEEQYSLVGVEGIVPLPDGKYQVSADDLTRITLKLQTK